jgi:uncharacterized alpha-E superfamily protein
MLSSTASELYWMSRYLERAENTARMLDVTYSMSLMPQLDSDNSELIAPLTITGTHEPFLERYGSISMNNLLEFFLLDDRNPSSIFCCIRSARDNAHAVKGRISGEVWESLNTTWLEIKALRKRGIANLDTVAFFDWVKERSHQVRGATFGTILRSDTLRFIRLGTFIERADNTARILDVKYQVMTENEDPVREFYRWNALLRSVGAYEAFQELYKQSPSRDLVAELLILRNEVPRSLRASVEEVEQLLGKIEGDAGREPRLLTAVQHARLRFGTITDLFAAGLHNYLEEFLRDINAIADSIHRAYLEAS